MCGIAEIDGVKPSATETSKFKEEKLSLYSTFVQPPVNVSTYTDPETKEEKCIVLALLFGGILKVDFDIVTSDKGQILRVQYGWPKIMFDAVELFKDDLNMPNYNPKRIAVEKSLENVRRNIEDIPDGFIDIQLPVLVLTQPNTWTKTFKKDKDGNIVLYFEFFVTPKDYVTKKSDKTLLLT